MAPTPRRSCLSVPGSSQKMLAKAPGQPADEIVVDLEDAVTPNTKDRAREQVARNLERAAWAGTHVSVRVNAPRTPWCHLADIAALATQAEHPAAIVVPKVEGAGDLVRGPVARRHGDGGREDVPDPRAGAD